MSEERVVRQSLLALWKHGEPRCPVCGGTENSPNLVYSSMFPFASKDGRCAVPFHRLP